MTYEIRQNPQFNSLEIYFEGKPSEAVRNVLKSSKFRWHSVKRCWYGYGSEESIASAITGASTEEEPATVIGDGYLGGGSIYGSKSNHYLHGADLSAAIRADLKKAGIKGVTVRCKTYTGGQNLTATVKVDSDGYADRTAFIADWKFPYEYDTKTSRRQSINHYYLADIAYLAETTRAKLQKVDEIISAYRYDNSNSMVDYFDTNFYYDIDVVPA